MTDNEVDNLFWAVGASTQTYTLECAQGIMFEIKSITWTQLSHAHVNFYI